MITKSTRGFETDPLDWSAIQRSIDRCADVILVAVTLLAILSIWRLERFPTQDGPSHVYNAAAMLQLATDPPQPLAEIFALRTEPVPNWLGHGLLIGLMGLGIEPLVAERLLVTLYLVGMAAGCRMLLRAVAPGQVVWAPLWLPLAFNFPFLMGFYNFAIGLPVLAVAAALALQGRDRLSLPLGAALSVLLVVLVLAHLVNVGMAVVILACILLTNSPQRARTALQLGLILLPAANLCAWCALSAGPPPSGRVPLWRIFSNAQDESRMLGTRLAATVLWPTPGHAPTLAAALAGLIVIFALAMAVWRLVRGGFTEYLGFCRVKGPVVVAAAELVALALFCPQNWGDLGGRFPERLGVVVGLLLLACLPAARSGWSAAVALTLSGGIALTDLAVVDAGLRRADRELASWLDGVPRLPENARVLPLLLEPQPTDQIVLTEHLIDYLCLNRGVVDWSNYEPRDPSFPIRFADGVAPPDLDALRRGGGVQTAADLARVDIVVVGPSCPPQLRHQVEALFPQEQRVGRLTIQTRASEPTKDRLGSVGEASRGTATNGLGQRSTVGINLPGRRVDDGRADDRNEKPPFQQAGSG